MTDINDIKKGDTHWALEALRRRCNATCAVEEKLMRLAKGLDPIPEPEVFMEWAKEIGVPDEYKAKPQPAAEWLTQRAWKNAYISEQAYGISDDKGGKDYLEKYLTSKFGSPDEWVSKAEVQKFLQDIADYLHCLSKQGTHTRKPEELDLLLDELAIKCLLGIPPESEES